MTIPRTMLLLLAILPGGLAAQEPAPPPAITPAQAAVLAACRVGVNFL